MSDFKDSKCYQLMLEGGNFGLKNCSNQRLLFLSFRETLWIDFFLISKNQMKNYFFMNLTFYLIEPLIYFLFKNTKLLSNILNWFFEFLIKFKLFELNILEHLMKSTFEWRFEVLLLKFLHIKFQWSDCVFIMFWILSANWAYETVLMT